MMISTRGRYALRVLVDLAEHQEDGCVTLRNIADRQAISEKYLESIVRELVLGGILTGQRGKGGGYLLSRVPGEIRALDVLRLTEGALAPVACLQEGALPCSRADDCRTLPLWEGLEQAVTAYLKSWMIQDLMR